MTPKQLAAQDRHHHIKNGVDLNPFSTLGARHLWALGFQGKPLDQLIHPKSIYAGFYERGQEAATLQEQTT
jgi:hypothetical protein